MKQFAILFAAVIAIGVMASESQAQHYRGYGNRGGGGFAISVGNGFGSGFSFSQGNFGHPGFGYGNFGRPGFGGGGFYAPAPVFRPVYAPVYGGFGGGFGGRPVYGGGYRRGCGW